MRTVQPKPLGLEIELLRIPRAQILGPEKETADFLSEAGFIPDVDWVPDAWDGGTRSYLFLWYSVVVVKRKLGFAVLGTGRMLHWAEEIHGQDFELPVIVVKGRISREVKLRLLAAELFGIHALGRTRQHLPKRMFALWRLFQAEGIETIRGNLPVDFALGLGYSLTAITGNSVGNMDEQRTTNKRRKPANERAEDPQKGTS
jgi:hypothetical protein